MSSSYFDVAILGRRTSTLVAAALLAKRGFRVLVLRQGTPAPTFASGDLRLPSTPFAMLPASSPITQRIFGELALTPLLRRATVPTRPPLQVALPGHRLDLWDDPEERRAEIEREFPEVRRAANDFHLRLAESMEAFDELLEKDLVWPPGGFFERREFNRASSPALRHLGGGLSLEELADEHPFRATVRAVSGFNDGMNPERASPLQLARPWYQWFNGAATLEDGLAGLDQLLAERVVLYGGELRDERADMLEVGRAGPTSLRIAGSHEKIGVGHVLFGLEIHRLMRLMRDRRPFGELFERLGEPQTAFYRYGLTITVSPDGLPEGLGRHLFVIRSLRKPLHSENVLWIERRPGPPDLLVIQAMLHRRLVEESSDALALVRDRVLSTVETVMPFIRPHILRLDSPHDGRQPEDGERRPIGRLERPWERGGDWMEPVHTFAVPGPLNVTALPCRSPIPRLLLCNSQVVPGLGLEGELLTAWSCSRVVSRADRRKEWMHRGLWTKVEL